MATTKKTAMMPSTGWGCLAASLMCGSLSAAMGMGTLVREGWWSTSTSLTSALRCRSR